jgi:hypothetical protein
MKKKYLKWVTKWMSEGYKIFMRDGIKRLYSADEDYKETFECTYTSSDNQPLEENAVEEEILDLICDAIRGEMKFGDATVEHFEIEPFATSGKPAQGYTRIILPVKRV